MPMWRKPPTEPNAVPAALPSICPVCRGQSISTAAKVASTDAYWRCADCGEVWNDARRGDGRGGPSNRRR